MDLLEILGKVGFDWRLALLNLFNFLIIFFLLKKYLFGPVMSKLEERRKLVEKGVEDAQQAETSLTMARQEAEKITDKAKREANQIMEEAHERAQKQSESMREKAEVEVESLIKKAKESIAAEKAGMKEELRAETVSLVIHVTEKILNEKMDAKKDEAYIKDIITTLKG